MSLVSIRGANSSSISDYIFFEDAISRTLSQSGPFNSFSGTTNQIGYDSLNSGAECKLDDIRIYNRALSASEVSQLYRGGRGYGYRPRQRVYAVPSLPAPTPTPQIIVKKPEPPAPTTSNPYDWELDRSNPINQGLVGAWCPSLGPSGSRLLDKSGNANHGVLTNMRDAQS